MHICLVTRGTRLTTCSTLNIRSPTHSTGLSNRSTCQSTRSTSLSIRLYTGIICLTTISTRSTICSLLMTDSSICE